MCNQPEAEKAETPPHRKREEDIVMTPELDTSPQPKAHPQPAYEDVMSRSSDSPEPKGNQELLIEEYQRLKKELQVVKSLKR